MNYPYWELWTTGGGFWIALIAIVHVFVSHFAVGGGLFLVLLESKARNTQDKGLLDFVRVHAKFFLLLTMVFGGLTGVGIWFTISLLNPAATSVLIHNFVFGWATEWVFFFVEIAALLIYVATFDKMNPKTHIKIGWIYFGAAWASLFIINGILTFMLTPGGWLQNGNFWLGFFNPGFLPALVFRTFLALTIAGLFGFFTSAFLRDRELRLRAMKACATWLLPPFLLSLPAAWWYLHATPPEVREIILQRSPEIYVWLGRIVMVGGALGLASLLATVLGWLRPPKLIHGLLAAVMLLVGLSWIGSFEYIREAGRRPFVIYDYLYSSNVMPSQVQQINQEGVLAHARWLPERRITPDNQIEMGRRLFQLECAACHSVNGVLNDILPLTAKYSSFGLQAQMTGQGKVNRYMPPFVGTQEEKEALAAYVVYELQAKPRPEAPAWTPPQLHTEIPPFDPKKDDYVLLAWNNLGMHCISDSDPYWVLLPPANDLFAQLIRRGAKPEVVSEGVTISYEVEEGFRTPQDDVRFWEFAHSNFGAKDLPVGVGLSGNGVSGDMKYEEAHHAFGANLIPVTCYQDGKYNPFPVFEVTARDTEGALLARTKVVAPNSTEMGCRNCHGGPWRVDGVAGFSDATSADILFAHDRYSRTNLLEQAQAGEPHLCQSCHADPVLGTQGQPELLSFPAAMHGWHANYLSDAGADACARCHPSSPTGSTHCLRGAHRDATDCTSCHGTLEDHALSLLKYEHEHGKKGAARLMANLRPRKVSDVAQINARQPWLNEPDCSGCHKDFNPAAENASAFNQWTPDGSKLYRMSHDGTGKLMCEACHGSTHAVYPAHNIFEANRDNLQPLQYQGNTRSIGAEENCALCHKKKMTMPMHHPNMGLQTASVMR